MRFRVRAPSGVITATLADDATVFDLQALLAEKYGLESFDLKLGFPPKPLDLSQYDYTWPLEATGLKLNGEQLILEPKAAPAEEVQAQRGQSSTSTDLSTAAQASAAPLKLERKQKDLSEDPPEIPLPSRGGTVVLRVMPDDNSCMFRAFGTTVLTDSLDAMTELRALVAQGIQANPDLYGEAVLQKPPDDYCRWIQREDSWGGGIELSILSQAFDIEVCSINVQDLRVDRFNEGKPRRCILVYSGIHYDTVALSPSEPPHVKADLPADFDVKLFDSADEDVLQAARELCQELQKRRYFTDTAKFDIKCNKCGWKGQGEQDAVEHATETGHYDFGEA